METIYKRNLNVLPNNIFTKVIYIFLKLAFIYIAEGIDLYLGFKLECLYFFSGSIIYSTPHIYLMILTFTSFICED